MTVIQPSMSGLVLRWSLACKRLVRDALRRNARRKKREDIALGRGRGWATIQAQQRSWLTPRGFSEVRVTSLELFCVGARIGLL